MADTGEGGIPPIERWHQQGLNRLLGIEDLQVGPDGTARASMDLADEHRNPSGLVHGGALFSLIDSAIAAALVGTLRRGEWMATESTTVDFLRPAEGLVTARARVDKRGRSTAYVSATLEDRDGRLVARATGVWAIRSSATDAPR